MKTPLYDSPHQRISEISTAWSMVYEAHRSHSDQATIVRAQLLERYCGAIYRYLKSIVGDPDAVDELCQEFALRFARGAFRNAEPANGRFRDFIKAAVINLVKDYRRRQASRKQMHRLSSSIVSLTAADSERENDTFQKHWTEALIHRAWMELEQFEKESGSQLFTILKFRAENMEYNSEESSKILSEKLGREISAQLFRQTLRRARVKFARILVDEVGKVIGSDSLSEIKEELAELGLLIYCEPIFQQNGC